MRRASTISSAGMSPSSRWAWWSRPDPAGSAEPLACTRSMRPTMVTRPDAGGQIPVGAGDVDVPEIGGQHRHAGADVLARLRRSRGRRSRPTRRPGGAARPRSRVARHRQRPTHRPGCGEAGEPRSQPPRIGGRRAVPRMTPLPGPVPLSVRASSRTLRALWSWVVPGAGRRRSPRPHRTAVGDGRCAAPCRARRSPRPASRYRPASGRRPR